MTHTVLPWILMAAAASPVALDHPVATAHIESISPDVDGGGGTIVTRAIALGGDRERYAFGGKQCRGHRVDATVLAELFAAMRGGGGVTITGVAVGDVQCLGQVTFFAP